MLLPCPESQVGRLGGGEVVIPCSYLGVVVSLFDEERQIEYRSRVGEQHQRLSPGGFVIFQLDRSDASAFVRKADFHQVVLDRIESFGSFGRLKKRAPEVAFEGLFGLRRPEAVARWRVRHGDLFHFLRLLNGCRIGGEQSGHIIFSKYASTGDGILTSLKMMEVMLAKKKPMSELAAPLKIYPQVLENIRVTDKKAAQNDPAVQEAVSKVAEALGDTGRILVRESGTEPVVRVMVEAPDHDTCQKYVDEVVNVICEKGYKA